MTKDNNKMDHIKKERNEENTNSILNAIIYMIISLKQTLIIDIYYNREWNMTLFINGEKPKQRRKSS